MLQRGLIEIQFCSFHKRVHTHGRRIPKKLSMRTCSISNIIKNLHAVKIKGQSAVHSRMQLEFAPWQSKNDVENQEAQTSWKTESSSRLSSEADNSVLQWRNSKRTRRRRIKNEKGKVGAIPYTCSSSRLVM